MKIYHVLGDGFPAICLIGICLAKCDENLIIALLTIAVTFQGALYSGFFVNPIDIASNYPGILLPLEKFKFFNKNVCGVVFGIRYFFRLVRIT